MNHTKVSVWRKTKVIVAYVGNPIYDGFFRNEFVPVTFIDEYGKVIKNSLFAGHVKRLPMLQEGNTVELVYEIGTDWIKSIDGERWN